MHSLGTAVLQAALVLTSAAVDLCGPSWLLGAAGVAKVARCCSTASRRIQCHDLSSREGSSG